MAAALFDLDGVLIDTEPAYGEFWGLMGDTYEVPVDNFAAVIKGTTLTQILQRYFPDPKVQAQVVAHLQDYERSMEYPVFPGVYDFLRELYQKHIPCSIVTSSNQEKMANLWRQHPGLKVYFQDIVTDEDVTRSKPDPEPYLLAARRLGQQPHDTIVFEDSYNGLLSGRRAGAMVVALDTTNPRETLLDKADLVISSLSDITPDYLLGILSHK